MKKLGLFMMPLIVMPFLVNCNNSITITWVDDDGTVLEVDENVKKETIPTYDGPSLASWYDSECFYSFKGWSPEVTEATKSMTYTATYNVLDIEGADAYLKLVIPEENQDKTFSFEYESEGTIDVDWGDGTTIDEHNNEHTYESAGSYNVKIKNIISIRVDIDEALGRSFIKEVYLGKGITSMSDPCFQDCSALSLLAVPSTITFIGGFSISYCSQLSTIVVDENNPNYDSRDNCNAIISKVEVDGVPMNTLVVGCKDTTIPNTVISIGDGAFLGSEKLNNVVIPNGVTYIGDDAFDDCSSLTSIIIPEGVTYIGEYAFCDCVSLTSISIPNSIKFVGKYAFDGCPLEYEGEGHLKYLGSDSNKYSILVGPDESEETSYTVKEGCRIIMSAAFKDNNCQSVTIPDSVISICDCAFRECTSLSNINIPNSVTSIGFEAFANCRRLSNVNIPNSVTSIGDCAFFSVGIWSGAKVTITISNSVISIGNEAFAQCQYLSNVILSSFTDPNSIPICGADCFKGSGASISGGLTLSVANEEMANAFIAKGGGWPDDPDVYSWPGK